MPEGKFVFPELDLMLSKEPFQQKGKTYEIKPIPEPQQPELKKSFTEKLAFLDPQITTEK
ncbi:MAG TPA: hypothetical protein VJL33_06335 [Candidatus Bathyarchaeia archaeon]|nr:hypothetical protein [Candidatus Bathyarchaeia archaeon]